MTIKKTPKLLLRGFVAGEFGKNNIVTLKDFDGVVQDVSSYTTKQVISRSDDGRKTITSTATYVTDGSDGQVQWSYGSGDPLDRAGLWEGQVVLTKSGGELRSYVFDMEVDKEL